MANDGQGASFKVSLTPYQARVLWGVVDGAIDAGACPDGLEPSESAALNAFIEKLYKHHSKWRGARPEPTP